MRRTAILLGLCSLTGCGGGGNGGGPLQAPTRLGVGDASLSPGASTVELTVALAALPSPAPTLIQVAVELPPAMRVAAAPALEPLQPVPTLRGERAGSRYLIVCGDDQHREGQPLAEGPLFRLRLEPTSPRQSGEHEVRFVDLLVANDDGSPAPAEAVPAIAHVTVP